MPRGTAFDIEVVQKAVERTTKAAESPVIWSPHVNKRFRLLAVFIFSSAETTIELSDEGAEILVIQLAAKSGQYIPLPQQGYLSKLAGNKLLFGVGAETKLTITVLGVEE